MVDLSDIVQQPYPENPVLCARISEISSAKAELLLIQFELFVVMTTAVGTRQWLNLSDVIQQPDPENPPIGTRMSAISLIQAELQSFCVKLRYHGNRGRQWQNLFNVIQQPDLENPLLRARISELLPILSKILLPWQQGSVLVEFV